MGWLDSYGGVPKKPIQARDASGKFGKVAHPPKPSSKIKKAKIGKVARGVLFIPRGFIGESPKVPTRPMGLKEKRAWEAQEREKSARRTKVRVRRKSERKRKSTKIFKDVWRNVLWGGGRKRQRL